MISETLIRPVAAPVRSSPKKKTKKPFFYPAGEYWTDEEIMALPDDHGQRYELWDGNLIIMSPAGASHEVIGMRLGAALLNFVERRRLGQVFGGQMGCRLTLKDCFAPDVCFVSKERLRLICPNEQKFLIASPDLVVETLSPNDSYRMTAAKIAVYFEHGARLAWMIDARKFQVQVYQLGTSDFTLLEGKAQLTGEDVLPGFKHPLAKLFAPIFD